MTTNIKTQECLDILDNNYIGHMVYIYKNLPYIIPITFYYDKKNVTVIGYTSEGHNTRALQQNKSVALEVSEIQTVDTWKSVLIQGTFEELEGPDAKYQLHKFSLGVRKRIAQKEKKELQFLSQFCNNTNPDSKSIVYRINIQEISGKEQQSKTKQQPRIKVRKQEDFKRYYKKKPFNVGYKSI